jgi:hypothetical protein
MARNSVLLAAFLDPVPPAAVVRVSEREALRITFVQCVASSHHNTNTHGF